MLEFNNTDKTLHLIDDKTGKDLGEFCEGFFVETVFSDIVSGNEVVLVKAYTNAGIKRFEIDANQLTVHNLPAQLIGKGITIMSDKDTSETITAYTLDSKRGAPVEKTFRRLGWYMKGKTKCYLASVLVTANREYAKCKYFTPEKLAPHGTFEAWREGVKPFLARPEVVLALAIGASATVVPLLKEHGIFSDTLIFALIARSSTYKTTMLKLMASIYGKPSIGDGIIDTLMDTNGYFFNQLGEKNGFIHLIDDISAASSHDFTNDLYHISMGRSRGRLNPDGTPKPIETWCTTVVYTGETSIFAQTNKNAGLYARLIEFGNEWLTAEDDINAFYATINENYGVALSPLLKTLFSLTEEDIRDLYDESEKVVTTSIIPTDGVSRRIVQRFSILVMALLICNLAWNLTLKIPPVLKLMKAAYERNRPPSDPIDDAIQSIKELILGNGNMFLKKANGVSFSQQAWGVYGDFKYHRCLWVLEGKMNEMACKAGIPDIKAVQRELADRCFLVRDDGNHYIFKKIVDSDIKARCYGVYLDESSDTSNESKGAKKPKKSKLGSNSKQMKSLLEDDEEDEDES